MTDQIFYEELRATIRDAVASYLDMYTDEELRELATESLNPPSMAEMTPKETTMTEQMTREHVAEIVYEVIHERADQMIRERMAAIVAEVTHEQVAEIVADARAKTLADMTEEERRECRWMQCDAGPYGRRGLIIDTGEWAVYVADKETGTHSNYSPDLVTALPDLPRMEWDGTCQKVEEAAPAEVGDVIESADDPRLDSLPDGSVLLDRDGVTATKQREGWTGFGYVPIKSQGDEYGPWTVRRIGLVADQ